MRELDTFTCSSSAVAYSRRSARTERALDDPVRDMEGMLVDEYGRYGFVNCFYSLNNLTVYTLTDALLLLQQFKFPASWILYAPHAQG